MSVPDRGGGVAWIDPIRMSDSLWPVDRDGEEGRKEGVAGAINGNAPTQHAGVVRAIDRWCNIWRKALLLGVSARSRSDDQEESNAELYSKISLI